MGIRSTQFLTREEAINRIIEIDDLCKNKKYFDLGDISFEPNENINFFVDNYISIESDIWDD